MIKIRNGCFETNSSSSHAMIMMKEDQPLPQMFNPDRWMGDNGILSIWEDDLEFGRFPFDVLTDWYKRMCYAIASYGENGFKEIESLLYKRLDGLKEVKFWGNETKYSKYGYVDHQSNGLLQEFLKEHNISLEDFIFNDRYMVVIDGDEYRVFHDMFDAGLINKPEIEIIEGVYGDEYKNPQLSV